MKHRLIGSLLLSLLLPVVASAQQPQGSQNLTAAEIINRHLQAVGGREALARFRTRVAIGTVKKDNEPDARMAIMSEGNNRVSAVYALRNTTWQMTYDGNAAIFRPAFPRAATVIESKYREMIASGLMFNGIALYNLLLRGEQNDVTFQAQGTRRHRERQTYIVEARRGRETIARLYFDAENFMWVRTDFGRINMSRPMEGFTNDIVSQGDSERTFDFYVETSDFREVDGVRLPFRFEHTVTAPIIRQRSASTIVGTITEYRHNIEIDPQMFR